MLHIENIYVMTVFLDETSNDIIAGNGRVLKFDLFIVWLYLFKKKIWSAIQMS